MQLVHPPNCTPSSNYYPQFSFAKPPKVACIHEDLAHCQVLKAFFSQHQKIETVFLDDGSKALSLLFEIQPDLIFCDLALLQLNGYELCAMLRCSSIFRDTPIVVVGTQDLYMERIKARMLGVTDYLFAPITEKKLLTLLEKYANFRSIIDSSIILK